MEATFTSVAFITIQERENVSRTRILARAVSTYSITLKRIAQARRPSRIRPSKRSRIRLRVRELHGSLFARPHGRSPISELINYRLPPPLSPPLPSPDTRRWISRAPACFCLAKASTVSLKVNAFRDRGLMMFRRVGTTKQSVGRITIHLKVAKKRNLQTDVSPIERTTST